MDLRKKDHYFEVAIKPCPWCKETAKIQCDLDLETLIPLVCCQNPECTVRPKGRYQAIRKSAKQDINRFKEKILQAISYWNEGNPIELKKLTRIYYG